MLNAWEQIHNPYIVGNPIKGAKLFFGREDDFAFIKTKFTGGKEGGLIVLCGARRSGKTSILFQILEGRLGSEFLPVLIDMQSMAIVNDRQFVRRLIELIQNAANGQSFTPPEPTDNPFADLEACVARVTRMLDSRKLILAFDEYELIETAIDSGALSQQILRTFANLIEHRQVFIVFTGSEKLEERSKNYWDIFLSKALHRRISFLSRDDTLRLIREPVAGVVEYAEQVPERICGLTAGQPFYTQVICQSIIDHLNDERKRRVEIDDVERAVEEVIQNPLPQMIFHWNLLADLQKLSLAIIAELTRRERRAVSAAEILAFARDEKLGYTIDAGSLNKALDRLFHGDLVQREQNSDAYEFKMDLWRLWAMRMHSVWQVIGEIDQAGGPDAGSGIVRESRRSFQRHGWLIAAGGAVLVVAAYLLFGLFAGGEDGGGAPARRVGILPGAFGTTVVSTTPSGADVLVDGTPAGRAPVTLNLSPDTHVLQARLDGYRDIEDRIEVTAGDTSRVSLAMVEAVGDIRVETRPPGARVILDDRPAQVSPVVMERVSTVRTHHIMASLEGYEPVTLNVNVIADSTVSVIHEFARKTSPFAVSSLPPGATVELDGKVIGTTPFTTPRVGDGPHELRLSQRGFREWSGTVNVPVPNNLVELTLLPLEPGSIEFSITPYGDVYVDGKQVARTVTFYRLKADAGHHTVEVRHPQFKPFTQDVDVESGATLNVQHTFGD